jgi:hypothetical protein
MKKLVISFSMLAIIIGLLMMGGCSKDSPAAGPAGPRVATFQVSAIVTNPQGQPQGGATLSLVNPPNQTGTFSTITDTAGKGTIEAPAGQQVLLAKMGTVFQATINLTVKDTVSTVVQTAGTVQLQQNTTTQKVLVVQASAEYMENVLRAIGFTTFDSTTIYTLVDSANVDSTWVLNYLKQYSLVFSNCDGGSEGGSNYAALSRVYGRYVAQGGKIYGGHYNYYHLQRIWPSFYTNYDYQGITSQDSLSIIDVNLKLAIGFNIARWNSPVDSRNLSGYEKFTNLPTNAKVYGVIYRTSPSVGVIVENYIGSGKYLWTDYHNQDIMDYSGNFDPKLVKIIQYFLLSM